MIEAPIRCVVDASVAVKLFVEEPLADRTRALFSHLASDPAARFHVPDFFYVECANVVWKCVLRLGWSVSQARRNLGTIRGLPLEATPAARILTRALELAIEHRISAYDACYVATADDVRAPLITADERLVNTIADSDRVSWLGDVEIPPLDTA